MSTNTAIQWTDYTWSPWLGCRKVSPGCDNCYITTTTLFRTRHIKHGAQRETLSKGYWDQAVRWNKRALAQMIKAQVNGGRYRNPRVFPSLCDPFDPEVSIELFNAFMVLVDKTPNLTWLLLTKRPQWVLSRWKQVIRHWGRQSEDLPGNVWLGVSVEDQKRADERIPILLGIPAKVRFLSVEPMLERIDLDAALCGYEVVPEHAANCNGTCANCPVPVQRQIPIVDWVIFGGESGPNARPCHFDWIRRGVKQCKEAGVACFVKQAGSCVHEFAEYAHCHLPDAWPRRKTLSAPGDCMVRILLEHPKGGDPSEWPMEQRVREFPTV